MTVRLDSKVALVTGGGTGLGQAYALALAEAGATVVVNDAAVGPAGEAVQSAGPGPVVRAIRAGAGRAIGVLESVASADGVRRLVAETLATFGRLDILVNNAGIVRSRPLLEMSDADFDAVLAVHLRGTFLCTREALRVMRAAGRGGRIINITSGTAYADPLPGTANYAAAKGGIISFTRVAAAEGKAFGVTCNAVSPLARTRLSERFLGEDDDPTLTPAAVAPVIVFLASEAAAAVTGSVFRVARGEIAVVKTHVGSGIRSAGPQWTADEIGQRIAEICGGGAIRDHS
jgi:NAD(P)-dependent dehydrogenase (short-subunit alcohol dehydrogenase family)